MILVGYPQPVPAKGTCRILPLAKGDYPYVRGLVVKLNDALRTAAKKAKADFIDMVKARARATTSAPGRTRGSTA